MYFYYCSIPIFSWDSYIFSISEKKGHGMKESNSFEKWRKGAQNIYISVSFKQLNW